MVFNELPFMIFLVAVVVVYYIQPRVLRNAFLLIASYYFYMQTVPVFAVYMAGSTLLTYAAAVLLRAQKKLRVETAPAAAELAVKRVYRNGKFIEVAEQPQTSSASEKVAAFGEKGLKTIFIVAVIANLSLLFVFKYADFFSGMFNTVLASFGGSFSIPSLKLVAPLGISFYVFQSTGYVIDVYRKKIEPERNIVTYAAFVSFFPQISSGPIGRADQLLPQFREKHRLEYKNLLFGVQRFVWGFFKKVVIANWLGILVDGIYANTTAHGLALIGAAVMYGLFIYIDFSAYTDMALGAAKALGFTLAENFKAPYFATNFSGFWKRWHVSLTSWLTDYVFTPLVWSRWVNKIAFGKKWQDHAPHFAANIIIVFLISGLWHGANYNFLIWGALHGVYRLGEEMLHKIRKPGKIKNKFALAAINPFKRLVVFILATFAHIFFYFGDKSPAYVFGVIKKMAAAPVWAELKDMAHSIVSVYVAGDTAYINNMFYILGGALLIVALCDYFVIYRADKKRGNPCNVLQHLPFLLRWPCYLFIVAAIVVVGFFGTSEFVYFQF